ncbi:MAG: DUF3237 domain-containing protein [Actinobacteria bacterium]|nr:DUF3237 domain-containing protein [Actinomycetota bacterium]
MLAWEPLFVLDLAVDYERALHVGATAAGRRSLFPVTGGTFVGPRLRGVVEPGGMDWVRWREDGVMLIDVRLVLRTDDGALIAMTYEGMTHAEAEVLERFRRREHYEFGEAYSRVTPRFETGDARYAWLNRLLAVANGMRTTGDGPVYHVFAIT